MAAAPPPAWRYRARDKRKDPIVALVKSPALTPALLAPNCAKARKSTGPRRAKGREVVR